MFSSLKCSGGKVMKSSPQASRLNSEITNLKSSSLAPHLRLPHLPTNQNPTSAYTRPPTPLHPHRVTPSHFAPQIVQNLPFFAPHFSLSPPATPPKTPTLPPQATLLKQLTPPTPRPPRRPTPSVPRQLAMDNGQLPLPPVCTVIRRAHPQTRSQDASLAQRYHAPTCRRTPCLTIP